MDSIDDEEEAIVRASILTSFFMVPMVLNATIELGVLDIIHRASVDGGISAAGIASSISHRNPGAALVLDRMMRLLASHSILTCSSCTTLDDNRRMTTEKLYRLAPIGKLFTKDAEGGSMAGFLTFSQHQAILDIRNHLKDAVLEGGIPFKMAHGTSVFQYMKADPRLNRAFNAAVSSHSTMVTRRILQAYPGFKGLESLVDVGGGRGTTLSMIMSKYPHIKGINFDLPQVICSAPPLEGIEHVGGNMFEDEIPRGDAILLKRVCHNWGDDKCSKILQKCHEALPRGGKLIMIESILAETPDPSEESKYVSQFDNLMLSQHEGKERTEGEFASLGKESGFAGFEVVCCACAHWVMEFRKGT
ncbi:hypothetical protein MLD38_001412 [Melastoma candidum]|uniref:Uncharacterized protein n=1 Tax=Melastoma candidum TaxID=119954 RepID=A0ACB9SF50_9MYRT|nr:hypothetical protein MLD38_001412 [Melastoma candidum]